MVGVPCRLEPLLSFEPDCGGVEGFAEVAVWWDEVAVWWDEVAVWEVWWEAVRKTSEGELTTMLVSFSPSESTMSRIRSRAFIIFFAR